MENNFICFLKSCLKTVSGGKLFKDPILFRGEVDITVKRNNEIVDNIKLKNIVVDNGKQKAIEALAKGSSDHQIFRMAIGSGGAMTSDWFQPKIPTADMTELYHEVYRKDVYDPPSVPVDERKATFIADFNSTFVPDACFENASERYINEAALIMGDGVYTGDEQSSLDTYDVDESIFSIRTFKSIPFDAGDDVTITIRWTIFAQ